MKLKEKIILAAILIFVVALSRVIPHYPNFTALGATALFAGAKFGRKALAILVPLLALFLSNLILNNYFYPQIMPDAYSGFTVFKVESLWIYGAIFGITMLGFILKGRTKPLPVIGVSLCASLLFFVVTNFGTWAGSTLYPQSMDGLAACFVAGIPFLFNSIAGDLFYVAILFGGYVVAQHYYPAMSLQKEKANNFRH